MNYYTMTITSTEKVVDAIEQRLKSLNPGCFKRNEEWERIKPDCIEFSPDYFNFWDGEIEEISRRHPGEKLFIHYYASLGCAYHVMDGECLDGITTILIDETEYVC